MEHPVQVGLESPHRAFPQKRIRLDSTTALPNEFSANRELPEDVSEFNEAETDDDVDIDLFNDLRVVTSQAKGTKDGECEDRVLDKFKIPLDYLDSSASCVVLGCLDGHGGTACVEYVQKQLPVSILSTIRNPMKRKGDDCENLQNVLRKAFQVTDNNFLHMAKRQTDNSGTTVAVAVLFGPDPSDGQLRLLLGSLGDSRAVLYRKNADSGEVYPVATNPVHKPSKPSEVKRIIAEGGQVSRIQGIDRVIKKVNKSTIGLSVSRAMGDLIMKEPRPVISSVPEFSQAIVDLDLDQFLVLGSDGVFDFISDIDLGLMVANARGSLKGVQQVADDIVALAKARGSADDRTCVIVDFAWTSPNGSEHQEPPTQALDPESDDFDENIFNI